MYRAGKVQKVDSYLLYNFYFDPAEYISVFSWEK